MPRIAREVHVQRLYHSGSLDRLQSDVRVLFRKRLWFRSPEEDVKDNSIEVPLVVGSIHIGYLGLKASVQNERNDAYERWLKMAARIFGEDLNKPQAHVAAAIPAKVTRAAKFIREHYREELSLGDVATKVGLSRERLSRLFHETLGITFSEYLTQARITTARQMLLDSDAAIKQVACESGFQSLSQFNRNFVKLEGRTPREFRRYGRTLQAHPRISET
ncbi:MAG: helix-turn-helix domain-containing protein [Opitutales bacterium]